MPLKKFDEHSETFQPYLKLKDFQLDLMCLSLPFLITLSNHTLLASPQYHYEKPFQYVMNPSSKQYYYNDLDTSIELSF